MYGLRTKIRILDRYIDNNKNKNRYDQKIMSTDFSDQTVDESLYSKDYGIKDQTKINWIDLLGYWSKQTQKSFHITIYLII